MEKRAADWWRGEGGGQAGKGAQVRGAARKGQQTDWKKQAVWKLSSARPGDLLRVLPHHPNPLRAVRGRRMRNWGPRILTRWRNPRNQLRLKRCPNAPPPLRSGSSDGGQDTRKGSGGTWHTGCQVSSGERPRGPPAGQAWR